MSVLILAEQLDPSADLMVRTLDERRVPVHRLDTAWFPTRVRVAARFREARWEGWLRTPRGTILLEDIGAVWYRSPAAFDFPVGLTQAERWHASIEAKMGLGGVLLALPGPSSWQARSPGGWVNRPDLSATACYKPVQLAAAAEAGLAAADTLVTNDRDAAVGFVAEHDGRGVVGKMFASNSIVEDGHRRVAFTRPVCLADLADAAGIDTTTHMLQARVHPKAHDARVVVIGARLFGFAIHADSEAARLDFRRDYQALRYERVAIPADVQRGIGGLMRTLGLRYAAIDFVVDCEGRWVFIGDVNPGGQYGWLEDATGAPLTAALADLLTGMPDGDSCTQ